MTRRFELIAGSSAKFWEVTLDDLTLTTRYGRVGANGQQTTKVFAGSDQALRELERLVKEKTGKGYVELGGATHTPEGVYLEHPQTRQFFEISENSNHLRVRRGSLSQPCLTYHAPFVTPGKARTQLERLVGEWQSKGFIVTQPLEPIFNGSVAQSLFTDEITDHPVYSQFFDLGWASELRGERKRLFHFRDGLRVQGHFDLEEIADMNLEAGVIIDGDVVVSGVFSQLTYTYPSSTLITGSVYAQGLGHKDSYLRILGDVHVDNIVYGEYNDGQLEITGTAYGTAWISADHSMYAGAYEVETVNEDYALLTPKVLNLDGSLDWDALREYLFANKNPLRKGAVFKASALEPLGASSQPSMLVLEVRALAASEDVEGLTALLETWTVHDDEWRGFVEGRLSAPSSTADQRERLRALLGAWQVPLGEGIAELHLPHPEIKKLLQTIISEDVDTVLNAMEVLAEPALIAPRRMDADTRDALKEIKRLNQQANERQTSDLTAALELFKRVIEVSRPHLPSFPEDFAHDHLYALQGRLWCVNELAQEDVTLIERAIGLAEEILEFTTGDTNFHYSAEAELVRAAETLAHNALAWYALQTGKNLEKALEHIDAASDGLDYISQSDAFATVYENKVKILLALGRDDDAHGIVYQMRREYPDLEVFQTLAQTTAFERWDAEN